MANDIEKTDEELINNIKGMDLLEYEFEKTNFSEFEFTDMMEQTIKFLKIFDEPVEKLKNYKQPPHKYSSAFLAQRLQKKRGVVINQNVLLNPKKDSPRGYIIKLSNFTSIVQKRSTIKSEIASSMQDESPYRSKPDTVSPLLPKGNARFNAAKDAIFESNNLSIEWTQPIEYEISKKEFDSNISQNYVTDSQRYETVFKELSQIAEKSVLGQSNLSFKSMENIGSILEEEESEKADMPNEMIEVIEPVELIIAEDIIEEYYPVINLIPVKEDQNSPITQNLEILGTHLAYEELIVTQEDDNLKLSRTELNESCFEVKNFDQSSLMNLSLDVEQENEYNIDIDSRQNYSGLEHDQIIEQIDDNIKVIKPNSKFDNGKQVNSEKVIIEKNVSGPKIITEEHQNYITDEKSLKNTGEKPLDMAILDINISNSNKTNQILFDSNNQVTRKLSFNDPKVLKGTKSQDNIDKKSSNKPYESSHKVDNKAHVKFFEPSRENKYEQGSSVQKVPNVNTFFEDADRDQCLISKYSLALKMSEQAQKENYSIEDVLSKENNYAKTLSKQENDYNNLAGPKTDEAIKNYEKRIKIFSLLKNSANQHFLKLNDSTFIQVNNFFKGKFAILSTLRQYELVPTSFEVIDQLEYRRTNRIFFVKNQKVLQSFYHDITQRMQFIPLLLYKDELILRDVEDFFILSDVVRLSISYFKNELNYNEEDYEKNLPSIQAKIAREIYNTEGYTSIMENFDSPLTKKDSSPSIPTKKPTYENISSERQNDAVPIVIQNQIDRINRNDSYKSISNTNQNKIYFFDKKDPKKVFIDIDENKKLQNNQDLIYSAINTFETQLDKINFLDQKHQNLVNILVDEFDLITDSHDLIIQETATKRFYFNSETSGRQQTRSLIIHFFDTNNLAIKLVSGYLQILNNGTALLGKSKSDTVMGKLEVLVINDDERQIVFNFENNTNFKTIILTKMYNVENLDVIFACIHEKIIFGTIDTRSLDGEDDCDLIFFGKIYEEKNYEFIKGVYLHPNLNDTRIIMAIKPRENNNWVFKFENIKQSVVRSRNGPFIQKKPI